MPNELLTKDEWIYLINTGARSTNKSTAFKYLEYIGEKTGYENTIGTSESNEFDSEWQSVSEEEYEDLAKLINQKEDDDDDDESTTESP